MNDTSTTWLTVAALACLVGGGCAKQPPVPTSPVSHPLRTTPDPVVRVQTLSRLSDSLARTANQLPGTDARAHRRLMADIFAQLEEILPILQGPGGGAEFREQLQIIRDAQAELATGPLDLPPEPTIDTGLRAARDALSSIARQPYYSQADLTPLFDQLASRINELDTVRGPLHQVATAEAVDVLKQIISKMSDALGQTLAAQNALPESSRPTAGPTSEPTPSAAEPAPPATGPTTEPANPATEPAKQS